MTEPSPVLLVDLSSIGHPIWHVSQQEPDPDYTSQRTAAVVRKLAADHPHAAICCDAPGSFRKDADPTYKANRPQQEAALHHQIDLAREALEADGFPVWKVDGFEGDDLIATAASKLTSCWESEGVEPDASRTILIASADKDLLALVSDRVTVYNTRTRWNIRPKEVREGLGVDPCQVVDYLTLVGDVSDNIKGAKGIGAKTAAAILNIFGNLDDVYIAIDSGDAGLKRSQFASLEEFRPRLDAVRALVTMRTDVPLDVAAVFKPRVPKAAETFMEDDMDEEPETVESEGTAGPVSLTDLGITPRSDGRVSATVAEHASVALSALGPPIKVEPEPQPSSETATALVPVVASEPEEWDRRLEPRTMADATRLAWSMNKSHMFSAYGSGEAVLSTILVGRELGLPSMASLRSIHNIKNKHSLSADLMVGLVLKSGMADYFRMVESTDSVATFETNRKGDPEPTRLSFTIEQAEQADLVKPNGNWHKYRPQMLRARAKSELARLVYPDLLAGLYTPEELGDEKAEVA